MNANTTTSKPVQETQAFFRPVRTLLRGIGQVMFQQSAWTGLLFLAGIFWGAYESHTPAVAWGAIVGVIASTLAGVLVGETPKDGDAGLWGFNGVLVGCAFPTFLGSTWQMWVALVFCSMTTTWVRRAFNNVMAPWKVNSFTFPFVFMTWIFLLSAHLMNGLTPDGLSDPSIPVAPSHFVLDLSFGSLVIYWLKGISQVFLINSWVTGIFFIVALGVCSRWAAFWAMAGSAISLAVAILFKASGADISEGLMGFSPVLTAIAIGCTFYNPSWKTAVWAVIATIATVFIQAAMDVFVTPIGIPTLTGPFCIATWLFLLPVYKFNSIEKRLKNEWHSEWESFSDDVREGLSTSKAKK